MSDPAPDVVLAQEYDKIPQRVLDDMTTVARQLADPLERAGAAALLLHILHRRSAPRRRAQKGKGPK